MQNDKKLELCNASLTNLGHIGIVVKDIEKTIRVFASIWKIGNLEIIDYKPDSKDLMGGRPFRLRVALIKLGPVFLEFLQPLDDKSIWAKFIKEKGEGIHHFANVVSNYDKIVSKFKEQGHDLLIAGKYYGKRWCYFSTTPGNIVIEFGE